MNTKETERKERRKGKERKGKERKGKERKGKERKGKERKGKATPFGVDSEEPSSALGCPGINAESNSCQMDGLGKLSKGSCQRASSGTSPGTGRRECAIQKYKYKPCFL